MYSIARAANIANPFLKYSTRERNNVAIMDNKGLLSMLLHEYSFVKSLVLRTAQQAKSSISTALKSFFFGQRMRFAVSGKTHLSVRLHGHIFIYAKL